MELSNDQEFIVMNTKKMTIDSTVITVENRKFGPDCCKGNIYLGSGPHCGILIKKDVEETDDDSIPAHSSVEFRSFLISKTKGTRLQDNCRIDFWFKPTTPEPRHLALARDFIGSLLPANDLPGDYICLISKILKMMKTDYQQELFKVRLQTTAVAPTPLITVQDCEGIPIKTEIFEPVTHSTPLDPVDAVIDPEVPEPLTLATDLSEPEDAGVPDEDMAIADYFDTCSLMLDQTEDCDLHTSQSSDSDLQEDEYFDAPTSLEDSIEMDTSEPVVEQVVEPEQVDDNSQYSDPPLVEEIIPEECKEPPQIILDHNENAVKAKKVKNALIPVNQVYNKGKPQPFAITVFNIMTHLIRLYMIF